MGVLQVAGLGPVAREFLDRVNPTGLWAKKEPAEEPDGEADTGNNPGRWSENRPSPADA